MDPLSSALDNDDDLALDDVDDTCKHKKTAEYSIHAERSVNRSSIEPILIYVVHREREVLVLLFSSLRLRYVTMRLINREISYRSEPL